MPDAVPSPEGRFTSFAQAWQERAPLAVHRVHAATPHPLVEIETALDADGRLSVVLREGRHAPRVVAEETWLQDADGAWFSVTGSVADAQRDGDGWTLQIDRGELAHPEPYRLARARPFRGWVELPDRGGEASERGTDQTYRRVSGLALHDGGGLASLPDDDPAAPLTVELAQLVYAKTLPILKLAVYRRPAEEVAWDTDADAYAWTSPGATRAGLNLRSLVTGWTLDDDALPNSDDAGVPRST